MVRQEPRDESGALPDEPKVCVRFYL
jgi:hypothetical protein